MIQSRGGPELRVEAPDDLEPVATRIRRIDPATLARVVAFVGLADPGPPITVALVPERADLARATPRWIVGFARGQESAIVLFPARSPSYPYDTIEDVLRHEIAHVLIARAAGGAAVPRWFHEGLAMSVERPWGLEDRTRVVLASARSRFSIREIDAAFEGGHTSAASAYAVAGALVRDLLRRHGSEAPARILSRLAAGDPFEIAFARATGQTVAASEASFWRDTWWSQVIPFLTSTAVLWIGVTFLALYAIRTRRVRRAAQRKAWDDEERQQFLRQFGPGEPPDHEAPKGPTVH